MASPRLTALSHGAGCACKLSPAALHPLLADLPRSDDERLRAVRTLLAEETRTGMLVGVAVGWALSRELER